jgi:type II secretory pathway pseudopilin PulG
MYGAKRAGGFTLIELMVTMVLAIVIVGGLYMIYSKSVVAYRVENQFLDLQERARFGLEHLKRDLRRAGFQATPNSRTDADVCPKPATDLRALVVLTNSGSVYEPWGGANPNVEPVSITLFGDFFSGRAYRTAGIQGTHVFLQTTADFPSTQAEFDRVFNATRYLRLVAQDQFEMYLPIASANFSDQSVTTTIPIPQTSPDSPCGVAGFGEAMEATVAGFVRYRVAADTRPGAPVGKTDLIREEMQVDGATVVPGSQLVIADYVVDLQLYDFLFDVDATGTNPMLSGFPLVEQVADEGGGGRLGTLPDAVPQDLRFVTAKVTVRTESEDEGFTFIPREDVHAPLDGYEASDMVGACRTLTLASRVQLTSLAVRNMKVTP